MQTIHPVSPQTAWHPYVHQRFTHTFLEVQTGNTLPLSPSPVNRPCLLPRLDGFSSGPSCLPTQVLQGCSCHSSDGRGCPALDPLEPWILSGVSRQVEFLASAINGPQLLTQAASPSSSFCSCHTLSTSGESTSQGQRSANAYNVRWATSR